MKDYLIKSSRIFNLASTRASKITGRTFFRKLANHAFHAESLKGMVPAMIASIQTMVEKWKDYEGKEIEVFEEFRIMTSEVISRTAFGSSYVEGKNIFEMLVKLGSLISTNFLKIRLPVIRKLMPTKEDTESDRLEREIRKSITGLIKKREVLES
ncbi:hypothetical protein MKX01_008530 [Papaver californicum]|nr:hypothetical protein MKX01_008530 [Papaver californicum]